MVKKKTVKKAKKKVVEKKAKKVPKKVPKKVVKKVSAKTQSKKRVVSMSRPTETLAIVALVLNILLPGVGSLIGGKTKEGMWQLILAILSVPLMIFGVGFLVYLIALVWGIVTGAQMIKESN